MIGSMLSCGTLFARVMIGLKVFTLQRAFDKQLENPHKATGQRKCTYIRFQPNGKIEHLLKLTQ